MDIPNCFLLYKVLFPRHSESNRNAHFSGTKNSECIENLFLEIITKKFTGI